MSQRWDLTAGLIRLAMRGNVGLAPRQWLLTLEQIRALPEHRSPHAQMTPTKEP